MKSRILLLVITFAILALAGVASDDASSITPQAHPGEATDIGSQQTPDQELPVIVRAAATATASAQTILDFTPHRNIHQTQKLSTQAENTPVETHHDVSTPQTIPLLI